MITAGNIIAKRREDCNRFTESDTIMQESDVLYESLSVCSGIGRWIRMLNQPSF